MILTRKLFRIGMDCRRKLVYIRDRFPYVKKIPHEGSFALSAWARTLFPGGWQPEQDPDICESLIARALNGKEQQILFSPVLESGGAQSRPEILTVEDGRLSLYHLTEKTINTAEEADPASAMVRYLKTEWRDILRDAAYDASIIGELFPDSPLSVQFILPDRSAVTANDPGSNDPRNPESSVADFLVIRDLNDVVLPLVPDTALRRKRMAALLAGEDILPKRGLHCRHCEFSIPNESTRASGFDICWDLPRRKDPEILWLSHVAQVDETSGGIISRMIREDRRHFGELPHEELKGRLDKMQGLQIRGVAEEISAEWKILSKGLEYPLYFLDFEIARTALPLHKGMKPFDRLLFEWSCHRIDEPGKDPVAGVWLNTEPVIPNGEFARTLRSFLGDSGSIITWSRFENSQIRYLQDTLDINSEEYREIHNWFPQFHKRTVDMEEWTRRHYHHPGARGRTSLKTILAAALSGPISALERRLLKDENLYQETASGGLTDPYALLEGAFAVRGGTGAVSAYLDMIYDTGRDDSHRKENLKQALINYCRLDTLAMVILYYHWLELSENS